MLRTWKQYETPSAKSLAGSNVWSVGAATVVKLVHGPLLLTFETWIWK